jgi:hypothetical protein
MCLWHKYCSTCKCGRRLAFTDKGTLIDSHVAGCAGRSCAKYSTVMSNWECLLLKFCKFRSLFCIMMEFLALCQGGTSASGVVLKNSDNVVVTSVSLLFWWGGCDGGSGHRDLRY